MTYLRVADTFLGGLLATKSVFCLILVTGLTLASNHTSAAPITVDFRGSGGLLGQQTTFAIGDTGEVITVKGFARSASGVNARQVYQANGNGEGVGIGVNGGNNTRLNSNDNISEFLRFILPDSSWYLVDAVFQGVADGSGEAKRVRVALELGGEGLQDIVRGAGDDNIDINGAVIRNRNNRLRFEDYDSSTNPRLRIGILKSSNQAIRVRSLTVAQHVVPEPSTLFLFGLGLTGLGFWQWRRKRDKRT